MIIQCDHCSARFRMDDSKLANGPVKVRCAKCKEVFVVQPEESSAPLLVMPEAAPALETPHLQHDSAPAFDEGAPSADFSFDDPEKSQDAFSQDSADFSFTTTAPSVESDAPDQPDAANEFDWQDTPASFGASSSDTAFDLASFDAAPAASPPPAAPPTALAEDNDFDFGDVSLDPGAASAAEPQSPPKVPQPDDFDMDFGDISFSSTPAQETAETSAAFEPADIATAEPADGFAFSFNSDSDQQEPAPPSVPAQEPENLNFGEFSFGEMEAVPAVESEKPVAPAQISAPEETAVFGGPQDSSEEELPPSSLTTRKKSGSLFPIFVIFGAIILIIALAGSGVYFFGGPKAFSKVGLGFLVEWYGDKAGEDGSIVLKGVTAAYTVNSSAGELFVVRGEAVNNFKKPRASIQVKVSLLGTGGSALATKSAFCGNPLSNEQLAAMPMAKIEETMNNQFGDSLANLGLKPGASIPFVVVLSPVPKEATDYSVQVGGSTVAAQ